MAKRVVLAYSGGLDTSVAVKWIGEEWGAEVIAFAVDVGQGVEAELVSGLLDRAGVGEGDLRHDLLDLVAGVDVAIEVLNVQCRRSCRCRREGESQLRIAPDADRLAETGHRGFAGAGGLGYLGDAAVRDRCRVVQHHLRHPLLGPGQAR